MLVIGVIHGDEDDGVAIVDGWRRRPVPAGVDLWLVESMNPDGQAAQQRSNANRVDLNRNFPYQWAPIGEPGDSQYAGTGPASEPETQAIVDFVTAIRPELGIWYHQDLFRLSPGRGPATGGSSTRYAELTGLPILRITGGTYTGVAATWQRNTVDGVVVHRRARPDARPRRRPTSTPPPCSTWPRSSPTGVTRSPVRPPPAMRLWWRMTSSTMKRRNFSVNAGSSPDSSASARSRRDLLLLALGVGGRQAGLRLVAADGLGDLEALGQQVHERGVDVVDAGPVAQLELGIGHRIGFPYISPSGSASSSRRSPSGPRKYIDTPSTSRYSMPASSRRSRSICPLRAARR